MLNRSAVVVRPAEPYREWAAGLSADAPLLDAAAHVYLIPYCEDEDTAWAVLEEGFHAIFEAELESFEPNESTWPRYRTFATFRAWFEVELCPWIEDLCEGPVEDDEFLGLDESL